MLAFPSMITQAASQAGMKVPDDPDNFVPDDFPHFHVFCNCQLGQPMSPGAHWENAKVIVAIPEADLRTITFDQILEKGWVV